MEHYVGLDVGLEETSLCIVDGEGNGSGGQSKHRASGDPRRS